MPNFIVGYTMVLMCEHVIDVCNKFVCACYTTHVCSFVCLNNLVASTPDMSLIRCEGVLGGKESSVSPGSKVRLLLAQGAVLSLLDVLLSIYACMTF